MNRELALANKVMKEANDFTGWGFSVVPQENKYLVGTSLERKAGQVLNIVFEIKRNGVEINTFIQNVSMMKNLHQRYLKNWNFQLKQKELMEKCLLSKVRYHLNYWKVIPLLL